MVFKRCAIDKARDPKKALDLIFKPLIKDMKFLREVGLQLSNGCKLFVKLIQTTGDNLATNEMMRICRNFTLNACKFCTLFHCDLQNSEWLENILFDRTMPPNHLFNSLFNGQYLYCPDLFHDLYENGVVSKLIDPFLNLYYKNQVSELIDILKEPEYMSARISFKKTDKGKYKIRGTGHQVKEFFFKFPKLDKKIPRESHHWKCYLMLRTLIILFSSPKISRESIEKSRTLIKDFMLLYYKLFVFTGLETFTFKIHHIVHYPALTLIFGPLCHCSTWRYERFHQKMLDFVRGSKNLENIEYTMAKSFVQIVNLDLNKTKIDLSKEKMNLNALRRFFRFIDSSKPHDVVKEATIQKVKFNAGLVFVYKDLGTLHPLFCRIEKMFQQDNQLVVVCKLFQTIRYCRKLASFCVKLTENMVTIDPYNLEHYHHLDIDQDNHLINKDFHLVNEDIFNFH